MDIASLAEIFETVQNDILICLKSKISPLAIVLGFYQGSIQKSFQVLEVGIIVKTRPDFQITRISILITLLLGDCVRTLPNFDNMMNQK